jgi:hypothetical protein
MNSVEKKFKLDLKNVLICLLGEGTENFDDIKPSRV